MMKRMSAFFAMCLFSIGLVYSESDADSFLPFFFEGASPITQQSGLFTSGKSELIIAQQIIDDERRISRKALIFSNDGKRVGINLLVLGPCVFSSDGKIILDVSKAPGVFWGWRITSSKNQQTGAVTGIRLDWFADSGNRTTDPVFLVWDSQRNRFNLTSIDPSLY